MPHQVDALFAHHPWHAQVMVHDLVDGVEGVLFVNDGVEQDAESPDILLFTAIGFASKNFRSSVIWNAD